MNILISYSALVVLGVVVEAGTKTESCPVSATVGASIADYHNTKRRLASSSNMQKLKWNANIARKSQEWTDQCNFEHRSNQVGTSSNLCGLEGYITIGENLFEEEPFTVCSGIKDFQLAIDDWMGEKADFTYPNKCATGKACGHYTQVMWAKSVEVGCGATLCSVLTDKLNGDTKLSLFIACNYGPAGNAYDATGVEEAPFKIGTACSDCSPKYGTCEDNLCVLDSSYVAPCSDTQSATTCAQWNGFGYCDACGTGNLYYDFMKTSCSKTCAFC